MLDRNFVVENNSIELHSYHWIMMIKPMSVMRVMTKFVVVAVGKDKNYYPEKKDLFCWRRFVRREIYQSNLIEMSWEGEIRLSGLTIAIGIC